MKPDSDLWQLGLISLLWLTANSPTSAQIIPDATLPNNSVVTPNGNLIEISGGTRNGGNLFHSFQEFSIPKNGSAFFNNAPEIQNILTRVTGGKISNIDGLIRANGTANLFLLNPNGIVFGASAQLNIGGSFIGSTANSIRFADGSEFSAVNPSAPPLLTINVPIGLQFGSNPGRIVNQSTAVGEGNLPTFSRRKSIPHANQVGLAVQPGQTLALIGGDIQLNGGSLTASRGQIILGSVKSSGFVGLAPTLFGWSLNYDSIQNFGNIEISGGALINTSGIGGGKIDIRGGNVTVSGSRIYGLTLGNIDGRGININAQQLLVQNGSQISTLTLGEGAGGDINIRVTDLVELKGIGFDSYQQLLISYLISGTLNPFDPTIILETGTFSSGVAGNIAIDTGRLLLNNGASAGTATGGAGNGGNMTIRASTVEILGGGINNGTLAGSTGKGGDISIETERLTLRDGSALASITRSEGASGNISIKASESIDLLGNPAGAALQNSIATNSIGGTGKAGDITVDTKRLTITQGGGISSSNGGIVGNILFANAGGPGGDLTITATESIEVAGITEILANGGQSPSYLGSQTLSDTPGGNMRIYTPVFILRDGGAVSAASLGAGTAGNITINADRIEVIGSANNGEFISKIEASVGIANQFTNPAATGSGGELNLNVNQLIVRDGATVNVQALGTGNAGNLTVVANAINLDNKGSINASTGSGAGGNIHLQAQQIQLRRGSSINTNAGNTNGGNITINTHTLVAMPLENSDISANAQQGAGGRVTINTQGIFGTQLRSRTTDFSDITATSELGPQFSGIVQINSPEVQTAAGLVQLPENLTDPINQIVQTCSPQTRRNSFTVAGRGGLPPTPREALNLPPGWIDWRIAPQQVTSSNYQLPIPNYPIQNPLVEATGWVVDPDGTVRLVAETPAQEPFSNQLQPNCNPTYK
jgi:filamentous hemagglutinin family protein